MNKYSRQGMTGLGKVTFLDIILNRWINYFEAGIIRSVVFYRVKVC